MGSRAAAEGGRPGALWGGGANPPALRLSAPAPAPPVAPFLVAPGAAWFVRPAGRLGLPAGREAPARRPWRDLAPCCDLPCPPSQRVLPTPPTLPTRICLPRPCACPPTPRQLPTTFPHLSASSARRSASRRARSASRRLRSSRSRLVLRSRRLSRSRSRLRLRRRSLAGGGRARGGVGGGEGRCHLASQQASTERDAPTSTVTGYQ